MNTAAISTPRALYTVNETLQALGVSRPTLYGMLRARTLRSVLIGRSRRIPATEIERISRATYVAVDPKFSGQRMVDANAAAKAAALPTKPKLGGRRDAR